MTAEHVRRFAHNRRLFAYKENRKPIDDKPTLCALVYEQETPGPTPDTYIRNINS